MIIAVGGKVGKKMERLIDGDVLVELLKRQAELHKSDGLLERSYGVLDAYKYVLRATIDAVPVVRCKDCKHSEHWYRDKRRCFLWHETGIGVFEDGYCNYAERKDNE